MVIGEYGMNGSKDNKNKKQSNSEKQNNSLPKSNAVGKRTEIFNLTFRKKNRND